jgi:hypothetical protein
MHKNQERGIAIVLALFLMSAMSVLAASLMFLSQTETYASMNYRMMSQARYGGEAAVQKASDFLFDPAQYSVPGSAADPVSNYNRNVSPVTRTSNNQPVILSTVASPASNYPAASVVTAFQAAAEGDMPAGPGTVHYESYATLLSMQVFDAYGGTQNVILTWEITGIGSLGGTRPASVEVVAVVETPKVSANNYAAFATADTCGALYFHGAVDTDSYDSTGMPSGTTAPEMDHEGGDIGTNGNMDIQGSVDVHGNLYSPKEGLGTCSAGNVTAETTTGNGYSVTCPNGDVGSDATNPCLVKLPKAVAYPPPVLSVLPNPNTTVKIGDGTSGSVTPTNTCSALGLTSPTCTFDATAKTVTIDGDGTDVTLPNIVMNSGYSLVIQGNAPVPQNININSFGGSGNLTVKANKGTLVSGVLADIGESVVLKVAGKNPTGVSSTLADPTDMAAPFDLGDWVINSDFPYDAANLQIVYGGTASMGMGGNDDAAAVIYAPNASFALQGNSSFFGSILAKTIANGGNPGIYYDRRLQRSFYVAGTPMAGSFTWKRY